MTHEDPFDFDAMSESWMKDEGPDPNEVRTDVRRTIIKSRLAFLAEMAVSTAGLVAGAILLVSSRPLIGLSAAAFSGFAAFASYLSRGPAWRVSLRSVMQEMDVQERQVRLIEQAGWAGVSVCVAAMLFLGILLMAAGFDLSDRSDQLALCLGGTFVLGSLLWSIGTIRKAKRRAENLHAVQSSMAKEE